MKKKMKKVEERPSGSVVRFLIRYELIILFILLYLAYNMIDGVWLMSGDTTPASLLPYALVNNHNFFLDFATSYTTAPDFAYAFRFVQGHYVSMFPIVTPVLATPVYALSTALSYFISTPVYGDNLLFFMSKSAASFLAALSGVFVYLSVKELFSRRIALLTTFIFAFATATWSISSQALWQHGTVELLLAALLYLLIRNERETTSVNIFLMGVLSGLFVFNRPPDSLLLIPVAVYLLWKERAKIPQYLLGGILGGLPFFLYNYTLFGNVFGGYAENLSLFAINISFIGHFLALLIAPNTGLFVFCPVLLLSFAGFYVLWNRKDSPTRTILLVFGGAAVLEVLVYSFFIPWASSAAFCFGPRFLTALIPLLCIYLGYFLDEWLGTGNDRHQGFERKLVIGIMAVLVIVSAGIQFIGVFFYLYSAPSNHTISDDRAWNVSDSLIVRSYTEGAGKAPGISLFVLPPIPPLIRYDF
jgi:4-amino-4-deoxy-L-arabinose transferase-like glycosyltransferase